ncbi:MAG: hypothetical protein ACREE4_18830, partial [Stellaceae bacterium]
PKLWRWSICPCEFTTTSTTARPTSPPSPPPSYVSSVRTLSFSSFNNSNTLLDERNFAFGDSFVLVLNTQEFINRIDKAVRLARLCGDYNLVEYYDIEKLSGDVGPFRKSALFSYQREFIIVVYPGSPDPIRLSVGSLEDITTPILLLSEINSLVDFSPSAAKAAGLS